MEYKDRGYKQNLDWYGFLNYELGRLTKEDFNTWKDTIEEITKELRFYEDLLLKH